MKKLGLYCLVQIKEYTWDENSELYGVIGGSEIWATNIAREFANKGYDVYLFGNPAVNHTSANGVKYLKTSEFKEYNEKVDFDYLIFSRSMLEIDETIRCKNIYLMLHDTSILDFDPNKLKYIKKIAYQSEYQKNAIINKYRLDENIFFKTFEAIHQEYYDCKNNCDKKNKMLLSQGYGRGSRWIVEKVFPLIRKEVPDFEINLCSYNSGFNDLIFKQDGINILGCIPKDTLIKEQCESKIWIYANHGYDTGFGDNVETFSITTIENAYAKCACILGDWGCFSSTLEGYSGFVGYGLYENKFEAMPFDNLDEFAKQLADDAVKCLTDEEYRLKKVESSYEIASRYTWKSAAETFESEFNFSVTKEDLQIYVLSLKNYDFLNVDGIIRKPLQLGKALTDEKIFDTTDDTGDNISEKNRFFSETTGVYWIWKNALNSKYVGHEHHRRSFKLSNEDVVKKLKTYDIIVPSLIKLDETLEEHYNRLHIKEDLEMCEKVVKDLYPEYSKDYDKIIKYGCNIYVGDNYITTKELYAKINEFIFSVMFEIEKRYGFKTTEEWRQHAIDSGQKNCPKDHEKNGLKPEDYQMLLFGFLYERLFTLYVLRNIKNVYESDLYLIDEIYEAEHMKIMLCCIGRMENDYIREFVEHYRNIGVTNICLYDNNRDGEDDFNDVIGDYISNGFVILKNYRNITEPCQFKAYEECYNEYKDTYDWFLFFDIDEFLVFNNGTTLPSYLAMKYFKPYDMIHVNWLVFGDGGNVYNDGRPLLQRITKPLDINLATTYEFPDNFHVKSIVRGHLNSIKWNNAHTPIIEGRCCNSNGNDTESDSPFTPYDFRMCALLHFTTKTASEFADKVNRGFCDGNPISKQSMIEMFFQRNEITEEKIKVFKEKTGVDVSYLLPFNGEKNNDIKIYTLCFSKKGFKFLDDSVITPLQVGASNGTDVCKLKDNTGENISDKNYFYVEGTGTYWIWKNVHDAKYKGQMQYRRPLSGVGETMDFEEIFKNYDVITCEPFYHPDHSKPKEDEPMFIPAETVEGGYAFSNCADDLTLLEIAIKMYYPEYSDDYDKYIKNGGNLYYSNGFIMKSEDYDRYSEFLFGCLEKYLMFANIHNEKELIDHVKYNIEVGKYIRYENNRCTENDIMWQSRIGGFLSERIWTLWLQHNFSNDRIYKLPYIKMEKNMYT